MVNTVIMVIGVAFRGCVNTVTMREIKSDSVRFLILCQYSLSEAFRNDSILRFKLIAAFSGTDIMMRISVLALVVSSITLGACSSNDYAPSAGTEPKAMFETACVGCHVPTASGKVIALSAKNNSPKAVAAKVGSGSMAMPKFSNIKGAELEALSAWVVANSEPKK